MKLDKRGRGRFKPAPNLSLEEIKKVLAQKNRLENLRSVANTYEILPNCYYRQDKFNVVSLFSGCGGLDLGFELAGLVGAIGEEAANKEFQNRENYEAIRSKSIFHTVYNNDVFREANLTYRVNFPGSVITDQTDIRKIKKFPRANIVLGEFPCPGFSEAGPRLIDDERNFLYLHFIRCLIESQPEVFVAENVKGMLTLGQGEVARQIIEDFSSAGYKIQFKLLNARDYGVPQIRERVFIVGVRADIDFEYQYPIPTHGDKPLKPYVTLQDAIYDLRENPGDYFTGLFSTIFMSRNRKKQWNEQSFTIQASGRHAPLHPDGPDMQKVGTDEWRLLGGSEQYRRLSVREIARIQTFPDWYQFCDGGNISISRNGRLDKIYKQIGNAVPVLLSKAVALPIAEWVKQYLRDNKKCNVKLPQQVQLELFGRQQSIV